MPESGSTIVKSRAAGELNTVQRRRLSSTCIYIDGLLCDIEHALHSAESETPFPRYVVDITPAQSQLIQGHIRHLRQQLLIALDWQHMKPEEAAIPVSRSVMTDLGFVEIAIEELKPAYMRGCGPVPEDAIGGLNHVVDELRSLVQGISRSVRRELGIGHASGSSETKAV
jgi:Ni,Fe-hydrogenase III small subunit